MCTILAAVVGGAAAVSAYSAHQQSKAQANLYQNQATAQKQVAEVNAQSTENVAEYNATVRERNAEILDSAAEDSIVRGVADAAESRQKTQRSNAKGRAAFGSSGIDPNSGTAVDLQGQNTEFGEMNALTILNNAEREAYGYKVKALDERTGAQGERFIGDTTARNTRYAGEVGANNLGNLSRTTRYAGLLDTTTTLVNGAASVGKLYPDLFSKAGS